MSPSAKKRPARMAQERRSPVAATCSTPPQVNAKATSYSTCRTPSKAETRRAIAAMVGVAKDAFGPEAARIVGQGIVEPLLSGPQLVAKYGRLPNNPRESAMWFAGFEAGKKQGARDVREALQTMLGLDERLEDFVTHAELPDA